MGYMVKSWTVVGFTGDADMWCVGCARDRYGSDSEGVDVVTDGEGNVVFPIFADQVSGEVCGGCGGEL